jgi:hypothetical protein
MMTAQQSCLLFMFAIGTVSATFLINWDHTPRRQRFLIVAWLVFWLGPPLYFIWTKGVLG